MSSKLQKLFIECVGNCDVEGVVLYKDDMPTDVLTRMKTLAKKKDYLEIVEILTKEIENRGTKN